MDLVADATPGTITILLKRSKDGDTHASNELFTRVYDELKLVARGQLAKFRSGIGELEGTSLVHAACERLLEDGMVDAECRRHFFFLFGRAMHDVLVEQARADMTAKRGGGRQREELIEFAVDDTLTRASIMDLIEALKLLKNVDPAAAQVAELRYLSGRTLEQTVEITGSSLAEVRRDWSYAKAWLRDRLSSSPPPPDKSCE